ncbi:protein of unknown function [Paraburkholderia kururiensis]
MAHTSHKGMQCLAVSHVVIN